MILLLVALLGPTLTSAQCFGGVVTFEKTVGMDFNEPQLPLLQQPGAAITNDCNALCKNTPGCQAFTIDYETSACISYDRTSVGRRNSVSNKPSSNLFEKVCLTGVEFSDICGSEKLWAFERVMDSYLEGHDDKIIPNMDSRTTCMKACLTEGNFTCRSAEYDSARRQCRLSREDRRTKTESFTYFPGSSVDYIENQCASSLPDCRYETRQDIKVISKDDLQFASSQADCESLCDKTRSFTCRAYTFDSSQNRCYLSGDDSVSLNNTRLPTMNGVITGEKMCTVSQCERDRGTIIFEKVTGVVLRSARETGYELLNAARGITENCADRCMDDSTDCPAFSVDYRNSRCYKLDRNTQGRSSDLSPSTGRNYFEKTCVRTALPASCRNQKWQFERVPGKELLGNDDRRLTTVQNRRDCIEACLGETSFLCRSAEYNPTSLECILSRWDRRTYPDDFVDAQNSNIEYLENQCAGVDTSCDYKITENAYPRYLDTTIDGIISEIQCQTECTNFDRFNCRSFAYYATASQCFLSGDDKVSAGETDAIENRAGTNFYDRDCTREAPITDSPRPTRPTRPETNRPIATTSGPNTGGGGELQVTMMKLSSVILPSLMGVVISNTERKLWTAAAEGDMTHVDEYLTKGTSPLWQNPDHFAKDSALHIASRNNHTEVVKRLLDEGVAVNLTNGGGGTALFIASYEGHKVLVTLLINNRADVNLGDQYGRTPLHEASWFGYTDIATLLIANCAKVNLGDKYGETPLHKSSAHGYADTATLLLENGADPGITDKAGRTAGDIARRGGFLELVNIIDSYTSTTVRFYITYPCL